MYALQTRGTLRGESTKSRVWARFYVGILSSALESTLALAWACPVGRAHLARAVPKLAGVTAATIAKRDGAERSGSGTHP